MGGSTRSSNRRIGPCAPDITALERGASRPQIPAADLLARAVEHDQQCPHASRPGQPDAAERRVLVEVGAGDHPGRVHPCRGHDRVGRQTRVARDVRPGGPHEPEGAGAVGKRDPPDRSTPGERVPPVHPVEQPEQVLVVRRPAARPTTGEAHELLVGHRVRAGELVRRDAVEQQLLRRRAGRRPVGRDPRSC